MLDDYVERELNAQDTEQVAAHLTACTGCARRYRASAREQSAYAQYLLGVEATPALWNNLQARIEDEKSVRALPLLSRIHNRMTNAFGALHLRPAHIAAFALIAIGVFIGMAKYKTFDNAPKNDAVSASRKSVGVNAEEPPSDKASGKASDKDSHATRNATHDSYPADNPNKKVTKIRVALLEKRTGKSRLRFSAFNQPARFTIPAPEIADRNAGQNAKEQLMLALRITSTQLYVAQRKLQEGQRRTLPSTPVSEPNREMR
ncbi:MAG: zf-HC2 domain-containing protein [Pyrinomonadaceae bacterium]